MRTATIKGTGLYAPAKVVTNDYFDELYGRDMSTFLVEKRNIKERHYMADNQATSDLIVPAAQKAMEQAGITASDLDLIIVATDTPDYLSPSTAAVVQYKLGAKNAGCFDLNSACAGFVSAMDVANKYIVTEQHYKNVLVVGAYGMSKYINWDDYKISSLFADGAGAVVLQPSSDTKGIMASELFADGQYHDYMGVYGGGTFRPITHEVLENKGHLLDFAKKIPIETNGREWPRLTNILLDRIQKKASDIDHFFLTQINIGSIHEALDNLGLPHEKSHNVMDRYGYTGSACIPMAIADAVEQNKLNKGDLVFMLGSGGGLSMAALAMEWGGLG
ncbi:MAG: ketoacyl-ACP synthase III [Bdellovibrionales bacterium]|nr:ketoacyl-ACP synthase III [Bdellovibrionales bacterium]